jgi:hypothetical protein
VEGSCEHGNELSGSIKCWKFLSSCTTGSFSRRVQLHGVSYVLYGDNIGNQFDHIVVSKIVYEIPYIMVI